MLSVIVVMMSALLCVGMMNLTPAYGLTDCTTIKLDASTNGGTISGSKIVKLTDSGVVAAPLPTATKKGYVFNGWHTSKTNTKYSDILKPGDAAPTEVTTYYATFTQDTAANNTITSRTTSFCGKVDTYSTLAKSLRNLGVIGTASVRLNFNYTTIDTLTSDVSSTNYGNINTFAPTSAHSVKTNKGFIGTVNGSNATVNTNEESGLVQTLTAGEVTVNRGRVDTIGAEGVVNSNFATVTTNGGTINRNYEAGTVDTNNATIQTNAGTVNLNAGTISLTNDGTVKSNTGTIAKNEGTVESSTGTVGDNYGTVTLDGAGSKVETTYKGSVTYNNGGTVATATAGTIYNKDGGTVEAVNGATIYNYSGTVKEDANAKGGVVYNFPGGTFEYNENASEDAKVTVYDFGGTITGTKNSSTVVIKGYQIKTNGLVKSYEGDIVEDLDGTYYMGEDGTVTLTPADGIPSLSVTKNGKIIANEDGTYTLSNITGPIDLQEIVNYTISYDLAGGTVESANPNIYNENSEAFTLNAPVRDGYAFAGWTGTGLDEPTMEVTIPTGSTGDRSYTATWTPVTYSITYDFAGGAVVGENPTTYTIESEPITLIEPIRAGYVFAGWTGTGLDEPTKNVIIPTGNFGNRTYTATWEAIQYNISYDLDGGTMAEGVTNPATYTIEDTVVLNAPQNIPNETGEYSEYAFAGWTGTDLDEPTMEVVIPKGTMGDREYKATWKVNTELVKVTFKADADAKGVTKIYDLDTAGKAFDTVIDNERINKLEDKTGYDFLGWYTKAEGGEKVTKRTPRPNTDTTYYAHWKIRTVTVTLDGNGGTDGGSYTGEYKTVIQGTFPTSTREGYIFNGWWSKDEDGEWDSIQTSTGKYPANDTTYYARWTEATEDVTYDKLKDEFKDDDFMGDADVAEGYVKDNMGQIHVVADSGEVENNYGIIDIYKGQKPEGTPSNYGYIGENQGTITNNYNEMGTNSGTLTNNQGSLNTNTKDGTVGTNEGTIEENKGTVSDNQGTIKFNTGTVEKNTGVVYNFGGTVKENAEGGKVYNFYTVTKGDRIADIEYVDGFTDYNDVKWLQEETGTATIKVTLTEDTKDEAFVVKADGATITKNDDGTYTLSDVTKNVTISAEAKTYAISYDLAGGTVTTENPASYTYDDADITLNNPTKAGYDFVGWSGTDLDGEENLTVTIPKNSYGDRTYTAHWKKIEFTITYDLAGGTVAAENPTSYTVESEDFTLNTPTREGYVFTGWTGTGLAGNTKTVTVKTGTLGELSYKATWKRPVLMLKAKASGKSTIKLTWNKVSCHHYVIYQSSCDADKYKKAGTTKGTTKTFKKLKKNIAYKYYVVAVDSKGKVVSTTREQHSITGNKTKKGTYTNAKSITVKAGKKTLNVGETTKLKMTVKGVKKGYKVLTTHTDKYRYVVVDAQYAGATSKAVKVSKSGKVTAVSKGKVKVYVMTNNGLKKSVTITVK